MQAPAPRVAQLSRLRILAGLILVVGVLGMQTGGSTLALFTSSTSVGGNAFEMGNISLSAAPTAAVVNITNQLPGDVTTGTLTLSNVGNNGLRYALSVAGGDALGGVLTAYLVGGCTSTVFSGALNGANFGSPSPGFQAGDRTIGTGSSDTVCVVLSAPTTITNNFQNATARFTITVDAEQTKNNP